MIGQIFTDYSFTHYPEWHWIELLTPEPPEPVIPPVVELEEEFRNVIAVEFKTESRQDIYTGIAPVDASLKGLYKSMGEFAGDWS